MESTGSKIHCRTSDCMTNYAARQLFAAAILALMLVVRCASGFALPQKVSQTPAKSREITMPDEIRRRCDPVPLHVLWLRLNIAPNFPSDVGTLPASRPQIQQDLRTDSSNDVASRAWQPETEINSRFEDDGRVRTRRDAPTKQEVNRNSEIGVGAVTRQPETNIDPGSFQDGGGRHRRRRHRRRRKEQEQHKRRHFRRKQSRRQRVNAMSDAEAWHCHMTTRWQRMPDGVFPPYLQTGSCVQSRCMMGLYECRPRRYAMRVLRRVAGRCNPLPLVGDVATSGFEEAWQAEEYHVTVGCECSKRRASGWYQDDV